MDIYSQTEDGALKFSIVVTAENIAELPPEVVSSIYSAGDVLPVMSALTLAAIFLDGKARAFESALREATAIKGNLVATCAHGVSLAVPCQRCIDAAYDSEPDDNAFAGEVKTYTAPDKRSGIERRADDTLALHLERRDGMDRREIPAESIGALVRPHNPRDL